MLLSVFHRKFLHILAYVTILDISAYALYYLRKKFERRKKLKGEVNEVLIFHSGFMDCKSYCSLRSKDSVQCSKCSMKRIIYYTTSCKSSIDICLYYFTCLELAETIVKCMKVKHVMVRVLVDSVNEEMCSSRIAYLMKHGIHVKIMVTDFIMHHKFIIIDKKVVISGSCNLTNSAIFANLENMIILSDKHVVSKYMEHFNFLWTRNNERNIRIS